MTDFIGAMGGQIDETTVTPLYLQPSAILVRPGNPKKITGFEDLLKSGVKLLVVQGAGQTGKKGDLRTVCALRQHIAAYAANSAEAKKRWTDDASLDAWLIWNIWQVANPTLADLMPVGADYVLYRDCVIALTQRGKDKPLARAFVEFLQSVGGARIFGKWGWMTPATP